MMAFALRASRSWRSRLTCAAARFTCPNALLSAGGIVSGPILKFCSERCVCAPQSASAGTAMDPKESFSIRVSMFRPPLDAARCARLHSTFLDHAPQGRTVARDGSARHRYLGGGGDHHPRAASAGLAAPQARRPVPASRRFRRRRRAARLDHFRARRARALEHSVPVRYAPRAGLALSLARRRPRDRLLVVLRHACWAHAGDAARRPAPADAAGLFPESLRGVRAGALVPALGGGALLLRAFALRCPPPDA